MKRTTFFLTLVLTSHLAMAQYALQFRIVDAESGDPLIGANVYAADRQTGATTDENGYARLEKLPAGLYEIRFTYLGYRSVSRRYTLPADGADVVVIALERYGEELETVLVASTRRSRSIEELPTRIEVITAEELDENAVMNSANISMLLKESTGIQVQQTSASSANLSLRIQGLDGRYTQILKDGFPLFGGFAGGLSLLQVPPLDLRQVEVIKGSSSTLYGGGAIAGIINLITKTPQDEPELFLMFNQTQAGGSTLNGFYAEQYGRAGLTFYTSGNYQKVYDVNGDDFSDLPQIKSGSFNPSFFYDFNEQSRLRISLNSTFENRLGGDLMRIKMDRPAGEHQFYEENATSRLSSQIAYDRNFTEKLTFSLKNSFSHFDRRLTLPDWNFRARQLAGFWEANVNAENGHNTWVAGLNLWTDRFREMETLAPRHYMHVTGGAFAQFSWTFSDQLSLESGLRADYNTDHQWFVLPRVSVLYKMSEAWTVRGGGGLGYRLPTMFTEEAEGLSFRGILPLGAANLQPERSTGGNLDFNYKTVLLEEFSLTVNTLFFYTDLSDALVLTPSGQDAYSFANAEGRAFSRGMEVNTRLTYQEFVLFFNYAWIDARLERLGRLVRKPITPRHNFGATLMYEGERWRVGYELYYTGDQYLNSGDRVRDFWVMGLMAMRNWARISLFVNFENFTDTRQSRFQAMFAPPRQNPDFFPIWAPTEGFIASAGIKWSLP